jgi:hypothetical protein
MRVNVTIALALAGAAMPLALNATFTQAQSPRSNWSGIFTAAQAARGEELYRRSCSLCHGTDLMGMQWLPVPYRQPNPADFFGLDPSAAWPNRVPELAGSVFFGNWNGLTVADLVERTRISMPMNRPGSLVRRDVVYVIAYVLLQGGFPPGPTDLTDRLDDLREIRLLAQKP